MRLLLKSHFLNGRVVVMQDENVCPICGEVTSSYMGNYRKDKLCRMHARMYKDGDVLVCDECGKFYEKEKGCPCKKQKQPDLANKVITIDNENKSRCITCGSPTDGLLFCRYCYSKYNNKVLFFRVENCKNIELLDDQYEGNYYCKDGHVVKSRIEREIDDYLYDHGIAHAYEFELSYGPSAKEVLHPDFYLPNYLGPGKDVYLEHWGMNENNFQYTESMKFKMQIYKERRITLICTYDKTDSYNINSVLNRKLNKDWIKENEINS
jgi:hypothetical protein